MILWFNDAKWSSLHIFSLPIQPISNSISPVSISETIPLDACSLLTSRQGALHRKPMLLSSNTSVLVLFFPGIFWPFFLWHIPSYPALALLIFSFKVFLPKVQVLSTYSNGHIYTIKWSRLQPTRAKGTALLKSICPSLPLWTFSSKIRMVWSCHPSHAAPSPKPCSK